MRSLTHSDIARGFVSQLDEKGSKIAVNELAALILENRMHSHVDSILESIQMERLRVDGVVEAEATSVYPLTTQLKKDIQKIVAAKTNAKSVILHEQLDPRVLGGVKITAPEMELNLTLQAKLAKLKA